MMTSTDILRLRLANEKLAGTEFHTPEEIVAWLGAVQAQDYPSAKWAIAQRLQEVTGDTLERAFTAGSILRTHVMRPTWHFVTPEDIRWMLALTAPRVKAVMKYYNRILDLDDAFFARCAKVFEDVLQGGNELTRIELAKALEDKGIELSGQKLAHVVMEAELNAVVCSGGRRGKQFTYALVVERAPHVKMISREEALAELVKRYFRSHGPAQVRDFVWWSGLTTPDANKGIDMNKPELVHEIVNGKTYWFMRASVPAMPKVAYLLPNYDEYTISYKDRSDFYPVANSISVNSREDVPFNHTIIFEGRIIGMWRRMVKKDMLIITPRFIEKPTDKQYKAFAEAAYQYGGFLGVKVSIG